MNVEYLNICLPPSFFFSPSLTHLKLQFQSLKCVALADQQRTLFSPERLLTCPLKFHYLLTIRNIFRLSCEMSSSALVELLQTELLVCQNFPVTWKEWTKAKIMGCIPYEENCNFPSVSVPNILQVPTLPIFLFTNQNVFDTNNLLLLNATTHSNVHFRRMKGEKVNATRHLFHFSPVRLQAVPAILTSQLCLFPVYLSWCICHRTTLLAPFTGLGYQGIPLHGQQ